ncbi:hypothetical protein Pcinc_000294 [Petrolisthes cinctipes]|uniref:Uncharacterized protein n=1 Tax=Petrolisthes cinctipes TaxID=88211 RepID=A0AAE1L6L0_PETCI|nr:hypothetical protein Pcinc_000294 [Petrolisthes cinctipes]
MEYEVEKGKEGDNVREENEEGEEGRKDEKRMEYEVEKGKEGDNVREENEEGEEGRKDEKRMEYEVEKGKEGDDVREENEEYPMKSDEVIQVLVEEVMRLTVVFGTSLHLDLGLDLHASQPVTPRVLLLVLLDSHSYNILFPVSFPHYSFTNSPTSLPQKPYPHPTHTTHSPTS